MNYQDFLESKKLKSVESGFEAKEINNMLFDYQKAVVKWACKKGKSAIFAECGLGKTPMQLEWAKQVSCNTGGNIIILAPLAVAAQTKREGEKFGIEVNQCRSQQEVRKGINITNYEMLHNFDPTAFSGVVLDESSILKSFTGSTRTEIIESFQDTPYKLACTATPAPNDFMELGNHCEFLNVMSRTEMLSMFFINDASDTGTWKLKGHAEEEFWQFVGSWAAMFRKPSDIGFSDEGFILPELDVQKILLPSKPTDQLFVSVAEGLTEVREARKESLQDRIEYTKKIVATRPEEQWLIWCNYNDESELLADIADSVEVQGSHDAEYKEKAMLGFSSGENRILVSKSSISGFGMNWQNCHNVIFCGLSFSYEQYYQAIRRCWRFGQKEKVKVWIVISEKEEGVLNSVMEKAKNHEKMSQSISDSVSQFFTFKTYDKKYMEDKYDSANFSIMLGDSIHRIKEIADESMDYSIFSPPFSSLYTYSNSDRDMGNCKSDEEFFEHFKFLIPELYRILKPGRNLSFHCMLLPTSKYKDGVIGLKDFRGDLIRLFVDAGFIHHSEVVIWKDPVVAMQRTKALGLLHKQIKKDSTMSRQGIPDYLITMRKPGLNTNPISHTAEEFPVDVWQKYASPVWFDINQSNTLQRESAREEKDEKHICPLQLEVIERALYLWTNPGDTVFSPFAGIGSEGYSALKTGRKFYGIELKESYYNQAVKNLQNADSLKKQLTIF